jgi:hypothetical protein
MILCKSGFALQEALQNLLLAADQILGCLRVLQLPAGIERLRNRKAPS